MDVFANKLLAGVHSNNLEAKKLKPPGPKPGGFLLKKYSKN